MYSSTGVFEEALEKAQNGFIDSAIHQFEMILADKPDDYACHLNLSTLYLQSGQLARACSQANRAIHIDPFSYLAYYNLFAALTCTQPESQKTSEALLKALSCAYLELGRRQSSNKLLNKAIAICENNSMAYVARAEISQEKGKTVLAQNDYETAIDYHPNNPILYLKKAEFQWRSGNYAESSKTIQQYWRLIEEQKVQKPAIVLAARPWTLQQIQNMEKTIVEKAKQFQNLLTDLNSEQQSQNDAIEQPLPEEKLEVNRSIQEKASKQIDSIFNEDPSDGNLTQQIEKLEKQIKNKGGVLTPENSQSYEETFLTQDIERAVQDIEDMKRQENQLQRVGSQNSLYSHMTLTKEDLKKYSQVKIQIVTAQAFEQKGTNEGRVVLFYGKNKYETKYKLENQWREKFQFPLQQDAQDETIDQIKVELEMKSKSIWSTKKVIGSGEISLLSTGDNKAILTNGQNKTGIVYFKLKFQ